MFNAAKHLSVAFHSTLSFCIGLMDRFYMLLLKAEHRILGFAHILPCFG